MKIHLDLVLKSCWSVTGLIRKAMALTLKGWRYEQMRPVGIEPLLFASQKTCFPGLEPKPGILGLASSAWWRTPSRFPCSPWSWPATPTVGSNSVFYSELPMVERRREHDPYPGEASINKRSRGKRIGRPKEINSISLSWVGLAARGRGGLESEME